MRAAVRDAGAAGANHTDTVPTASPGERRWTREPRRPCATRAGTAPDLGSARDGRRDAELLRSARAGVRRLVARDGRFADRDRPGWHEESRRCARRWRRWRPRARSTSRAGPASSPPTCPASRSASTRARRCSPSPAGGCRVPHGSCRATRSTRRSATASSSACTPATSTGTSTPGSAALPRRRGPARPGARRGRLRAAARRRPEPWQERTLDDGSRHASTSAGSRPPPSPPSWAAGSSCTRGRGSSRCGGSSTGPASRLDKP